MIHHHVSCGHGHTMIMGAAQVITVQPLRQLVTVDPSIGKQGGLSEHLDALILFADPVLIVEPGVSNLMDGGGDKCPALLMPSRTAIRWSSKEK